MGMKPVVRDWQMTLEFGDPVSADLTREEEKHAVNLLAQLLLEASGEAEDHGGDDEEW